MLMKRQSEAHICKHLEDRRQSTVETLAAAAVYMVHGMYIAYKVQFQSDFELSRQTKCYLLYS